MRGLAIRRTGKRWVMKLKTAMYAALGYATFKFGKLYAKRRARQAITGVRS